MVVKNAAVTGRACPLPDNFRNFSIRIRRENPALLQSAKSEISRLLRETADAIDRGERLRLLLDRDGRPCGHVSFE